VFRRSVVRLTADSLSSPPWFSLPSGIGQEPLNAARDTAIDARDGEPIVHVGSKEPILILGAGGFAREAAEAIRAQAEAEGRWHLLGFLDDDPARHGDLLEGVPVLGPLEAVAGHPDARVIACMGHPGNFFTRKRVVRRLNLPSERWATVIHPSAVLAASTEVGCGSVILASVVTTAAVRIGEHVAIMPATVMTHDNEVGDYTTFGAGVRLAGRVRILEGAYVGSAALIRQDLEIGEWSLLGMGSVVTHSVPSGEVWAGVPARLMRRLEIPTDVRP
jgi:sugar O-acyltransferase (sialic acid O-acetyltransferase NeuD family)